MFSIDLFVADAATGKVAAQADEHGHRSALLEHAVHLLGRRLGRRQPSGSRSRRSPSGAPALAIFDAQSGDKEREVPIAEVDEIFNPTWAPDGHAIAFTGMSRGLTDLFVYDLDGVDSCGS